MEQRALPFDHVPMIVGGRIGLSISAAPAAKSATTASIGMPRPAIMMPVWPVARKSASMPRSAKRARDRERGIFLAERAVGADGEQPLAAALQPGRDRDVRRAASRTSISRRPSRSRGRASSGNLGEPGVHAADDVEPGFERLDQRRQPAVGDEAAGIGDADDQRARAPCRAPRPAMSFGRPVRDRRARQREFADAALARPVAQAERGLGIARLDRVAEKQEVGLRQRELQRIVGRPCLPFSSEHWCFRLRAEVHAERQADRPRPDDAGADRAVGEDRETCIGRLSENGQSRRRGYTMAISQVLHVGFQIEAAEVSPALGRSRYRGGRAAAAQRR